VIRQGSTGKVIDLHLPKKAEFPKKIKPSNGSLLLAWMVLLMDKLWALFAAETKWQIMIFSPFPLSGWRKPEIDPQADD